MKLSLSALAILLLTLAGAVQADIGTTDWTAQQIATAPDGTSRVLWTADSNTGKGKVAALWVMNASGKVTAKGTVYGPFSDSNGDWLPQHLVVAADGTSRLLWTNTGVNGVEAGIWSFNASGVKTSSGAVYGPLSDSNGAWFPKQLVIAADSTSRLLWANFGGSGVEATIWKIAATGNVTTKGAVYGPYSTTNGSWYPQQLVVAPDGTSRLLWTVFGSTNSSTSVYSGDTTGIWNFNAGGNKTGSGTVYGPSTGWSVANFDLNPTDSTLRMLWYDTDSATGGDAAQVWTLNTNGNKTVTGSSYGPYAGWYAVGLTALSNGTSLVEWQRDLTQFHSGGDTFAFWGFNSSDAKSFGGTVYGPYADWTLTDMAIDRTDNSFRLLWTNADDSMGLWSVNSSGSQTAVGTVYGPFIY